MERSARPEPRARAVEVSGGDRGPRPGRLLRDGRPPGRPAARRDRPDADPRAGRRGHAHPRRDQGRHRPEGGRGRGGRARRGSAWRWTPAGRASGTGTSPRAGSPGRTGSPSSTGCGRGSSTAPWSVRPPPPSRGRRPAREAIRASVEDDAPYLIEYRIVQVGGAVRWIYTSGKVIRDASGRPVRMIGATTDVTERKQAEEDGPRPGRPAGQRPGLGDRDRPGGDRHLLERGGDPAVRLDRRGDARPALRRPLPRAEAVRGRRADPVERARGSEWTASTRTTARTARGSGSTPASSRVRDAEGRPVGILGLAHDITDRKRAEEALREADRRKDEFLALLAHELRNPLAPIRNGLQVLRLAGGDAGAVALARDMMERQLGHMVRLIDDLLDVSRISRNKMELRRARVPLADVVGQRRGDGPARDRGGRARADRLPAAGAGAASTPT